MISTKNFLLIALVCLVRSAAAQNSWGDNNLSSQLSSKSVQVMVQDNKGYLWIGTDDGLNRYDGYSVTVFRHNPEDSTTIQENDIRTMTVDSVGNIWAGHLNGSISIFDQSIGSFRNFRATSRGLPKDGIAKIFFDKKGDLWVCVYRNGLHHYERSKNRFVKIGDLTDIHPAYKKLPRDYRNYNSIYDIYDDGAGLLWLATHDGLYQYNQVSKELKSIREKEIVPFTNTRSDLFGKILTDDNGFWMPSWGGGLTFYNLRTRVWKNYKFTNGKTPMTNIILGMEWKSKDQLWVTGSDFGIGYFDIKKEKYVPFNTRIVGPLLKDKTGLLWGGAAEAEGLMKFDPVNLTSFNRVNVSRRDNGDFHFARSFYHDIKKHLLYIGMTYGDGLHVYDETTGEEKTYGFDVLETTEKSLEVPHIYKDNLDTVWVLTRDFIYWFDSNRKQLRKFKQPYDEKNLKSQITPEFYRLLRSHNGDLWITSWDHGVYRFDNSKQVFINYRIGSDSLSTNGTTEIVEDANERIWIRTQKGLWVYNYKTGKFRNYFDANSAEWEHVHLHGLTKSPNGDIWIYSDNGIYQYNHLSDSISFTHWTSKDGLPTAKIQNVKSDNQGRLCLVTPAGIFFFDPVQKKLFPTLITQNSKLTNLYIDDNGDLYTAAFGGYNRYVAGSYLPSITAPSLAITSFRVNNNELAYGESIRKRVELRHDQNVIAIEFAAFDFRSPSKTKYMYMMDGLESKWTTYVGQHSVNYENLPPGDFTFKVKASSVEGIWTQPIEVHIRIAPPFWGTWYFMAGTTLLAFALVYLFYHWRIQTVRHDEKVKSEFARRTLEAEMRSLRAQMNPHFIFNSLNSINKFILFADPDTASFYLTKFSRLIRLILENSRQSKIPLEQDLTALTHYIELELLRFDHRFSYFIDVDPCLDGAVTWIPPLIIQPYVENSIWHGFVKKEHHGKLTITVRKERENLLLITVEDNGVGRNYKKNALTSSNKKSHGLALTADRIKLLSQGSEELSSVDIIDLKNEAGEPTGTKVIIRLATPVITKNVENNVPQKI